MKLKNEIPTGSSAPTSVGETWTPTSASAFWNDVAKKS